MLFDIACDPGLGQMTKVTSGDVTFICLLASNELDSNDSCEVLLRYTDLDSGAWKECIMLRSQDKIFWPHQKPDPHKTYISFKHEILLNKSVQFEIRVRAGVLEPWINIGNKLPDSVVLLSPQKENLDPSHDLKDYMTNLNLALDFKFLENQNRSKRILAWLVEAPVAAAQGNVSQMEQVMFGRPWGSYLRWFALSRNTSAWIFPRHGTTYFDLDIAAIMCSFLNRDGRHLVLLGVSGFEDIMTIFGDDSEGGVMIKMRNDRNTHGHGRVIVAIGNDFEKTIARAVEEARSIIKVNDESIERPINVSLASFDRDWAQKWTNGLIFCPRNSDQQRLTHDSIMKLLDDLAAKGIKVSSFILEDGWQLVDSHKTTRFQAGLVNFEADPTIFSHGLKNAIQSIKRRYQSIRSVIVWHSVLGYWGGVSSNPEAQIKKTYETVEVERMEMNKQKQPVPHKISIISGGDVHKFYDDYYRFLSSCDVNTVKTDGCFLLDTLISATIRQRIIDPYLTSQYLASQKHFPNITLSSMSLAPATLFHHLKFPSETVLRNSATHDDHGFHVFCNASNALLTRSIGVTPDWGPLEMGKIHGDFDAVARAISGGPIQIRNFGDTDDHVLALVQQLSGVTAQKKSVIFRASETGRTMNPYTSFEHEALLKVGASHRIGTILVSILGIFNVKNDNIFELLHLRMFPHIDASKEYIIRSSSGAISQQLRLENALLIPIFFEGYAHDILCAYPLISIDVKDVGVPVYIATLGLTDKIMSAATTISSTIVRNEKGDILIDVVLKSLGVFGLYISDLQQRAVNDEAIEIEVQKKRFSICDFAETRDKILNLDLAGFWKMAKIDSNSDEIDLSIKICRKETGL